MLHAVKKHLSRAKLPLVSPPNAEFADYKQRLTSIKHSLNYTVSMLTSANRSWIIQMQQQRLFSDRFYESYPITFDDVHQVAHQFAQGSHKLYDKFTREHNQDFETFTKILHQIMLYIKEIDTLEKTYSKLTSAKAEATRYQDKLDSMERGRRPIEPSKKERNLQKMDRYKEQYNKLIRTVIDQQKTTYAKHPVVFKAALTAYWFNHEKHVNMLVESLEATQQFARHHEQQMKELDITTFEPDLSALIPAPRSSNHITNLASKVSSSSSSSASEATTDQVAAPSNPRTENDTTIKAAAPPISPVSTASPSNTSHPSEFMPTPASATVTDESKDKIAHKASTSTQAVAIKAEEHTDSAVETIAT